MADSSKTIEWSRAYRLRQDLAVTLNEDIMKVLGWEPGILLKFQLDPANDRIIISRVTNGEQAS